MYLRAHIKKHRIKIFILKVIHSTFKKSKYFFWTS